MRPKMTVVAGLAAATMALAACGGSGSTGETDNSEPPGDNQGYDRSAANSTGSPVDGGILDVLGVGDVDFLDPNISYYSVGYEVMRLISRQLYSFPAETGHTTEVQPDLATALPKISADGLT